MIRLSLPLSQFFDIFDLEEPRVPQALDDRIYLVHDDALDRERVIQDVLTLNLNPGAADTTVNLAFSVAQDHYLQSLTLELATNTANFEYAVVVMQPFGDPHAIVLAHSFAADVIAFDDRNDEAVFHYRFAFPFYGRRETDYTVSVRSGAGGGLNTALRALVVRAPEGVRIAH